MASAEVAPASLLRLDGTTAPAVTVSGRVIDEKGQGLPGVTVLERGTSNGATTDADGRFTLSVGDNATLTFSFVGYTTQQIAVAGRTTIDVSLAPDTRALNEVVVVGYLTQEREQVTGAVSQVSSAEIRRAPVATLTEAIQGRAAGVQVTNSGVPGQAPIVNIRGIGSVGGGNGVLYVVDGVWVENIRDINPNDVESATVLKDAASLAPYGSRGANGVIIVTTRRGRVGKPAININAYRGVQNIWRTYDLMNAQEWANTARLMYTNANQTPYNGITNPPAGVDTDWQEELIRPGSVEDYSIGFSGAGEASNFSISTGYFRQKGTIKGPSFERYSLRLNSGFNRGRLRITESAQLSRSHQQRIIGLPFIDVVRMLPIIPVNDPTTVSGYGFGNPDRVTFGTNPIGAQDVFNDRNTENRLIGSLAGELTIFDFLRYRLNLGTEFVSFVDRFQAKNGQAGGLSFNAPVQPAVLREGRGDNLFLLAENTLTFNRSFGDNNVQAVIGYSEQKNTFNLARSIAQGFGTGPTYYYSLSGGTGTPGVEGSRDIWTKRSYFAQVAYDYADRYLVTGAFRRDGSSRFDPNNRWGNFYAFSGGWRISKEGFFEGITAISNLKLRGSYGQLGNDQLNSGYLYQATLNQNVNYPFGTGTVNNGFIATQLPSTGIRWESRNTANFGFDLGLLEDRFTLAADYYVSETRDALVNPDVVYYLGNAGGRPFTNLGRIRNSGFEFQLGYSENRKPFRYGASANLTTIKNEVKELSFEGQVINAGPHGGITRTQVGQPVGAFFLVPMEGIFQTREEVLAHRAQPDAQPGDVKYRDVNGDGQIDDADRVFTGSPIPTLQYALNLNAGFKGFDLTMFFQGVTGNDIWNGTRFWTDRLDDNGNFRRDLSPWTPDNPSTTTPRPLLGGSQNARANSTRWLEDGSYLRLKNVQLGYTLPESLTGRVNGLGSVRLFVTGQNVFTITDYTGYDPEVVPNNPGDPNNVFVRGVDDGSFPNLRTFTGGLQVNF
ncbi:SusC/RagA family TonB-linked outer membrane protein [Hymenobacter weizhouensis]|uniref:SusC/RagA family TonB-linked outer membrane protein n=1 Tax=Hymenobacter sp. YIM 151500-1 TaxID=2987689 RepID=UPI0022260AFB|nr:TonB-dependent receptor [Hymenobacter sp. YIM 151500-1]UYZ62093.1 TonB-dependent receptor [Hymenobacter sp. YIM 151500-1]